MHSSYQLRKTRLMMTPMQQQSVASQAVREFRAAFGNRPNWGSDV
jgi:hypothetical protein